MNTYLESEIIHDRRLIRNSQRLNALLYDNGLALRKLFQGYAEPVAKDKSGNSLRNISLSLDGAMEIFAGDH